AIVEHLDVFKDRRPRFISSFFAVESRSAFPISAETTSGRQIEGRCDLSRISYQDFRLVCTVRGIPASQQRPASCTSSCSCSPFGDLLPFFGGYPGECVDDFGIDVAADDYRLTRGSETLYCRMI